jgi:hypothetical protein
MEISAKRIRLSELQPEGGKRVEDSKRETTIIKGIPPMPREPHTFCHRTTNAHHRFIAVARTPRTRSLFAMRTDSGDPISNFSEEPT